MVAIRDIRAKVELNAIEAAFIRDALHAYTKVCNAETVDDCRKMAAMIRDAFPAKERFHIR
jgi:hypothetical protein